MRRRFIFLMKNIGRKEIDDRFKMNSITFVDQMKPTINLTVMWSPKEIISVLEVEQNVQQYVW